MEQNDIFALASKAMEEKQAVKESEKTCIIVGEKGSGKSTLVSALTNEEVKGERKPTAGIDFKYSAKKVEAKKVVGNFHEIGGGRFLSDLLQTVLNSSKLKDAVVIIAIDMSQPDTALYHLDFWLKKIRNVVDKAIQQLEKDNPEAASKVLSQSGYKWEGHTDGRRVFPIPIQTIIVGTKYDVFGIEESENKKWMCRALRFFAHTNG